MNSREYLFLLSLPISTVWSELGAEVRTTERANQTKLSDGSHKALQAMLSNEGYPCAVLTQNKEFQISQASQIGRVPSVVDQVDVLGLSLVGDL